jgi:hypothetical protein
MGAKSGFGTGEKSHDERSLDQLASRCTPDSRARLFFFHFFCDGGHAPVSNIE